MPMSYCALYVYNHEGGKFRHCTRRKLLIIYSKFEKVYQSIWDSKLIISDNPKNFVGQELTIILNQCQQIGVTSWKPPPRGEGSGKEWCLFENIKKFVVILQK